MVLQTLAVGWGARRVVLTVPACVPRACPGSRLAVLRLPARTRAAVWKLQSVPDGPVRPAAAAVRL